MDPARLLNLRGARLLPLGLAFAAMFASSPGQSFFFAVFIDHILAGTGISRTAFSALYAVATIASATLSFGLGHTADRAGLRPVWALVAGGLAAACLLESLAHGILLAAVGLVLLRSLGQGSFPLLGTLVVNYWYPARRGAAMAIASFGLTIASVALPPLLALLIDGIGWRAGYRLIALVVAGLILPLALLVRRPAGTSAAAVSAEDTAPPERAAPSPVARRVGRARLPLPHRSAALLLIALSTPALITTAISAPAAAAALSLLGIARAAGTIAAGAIADRLGTRTLLTALTGALAAGSAILLVPSGPVSYLAFAVIGLASGIWSVASGIAWARTYGLAAIGRLQGLASAATIVAAAVGPLPLAISVAATGTYTAGLLFLLATAAVAFAAALQWRAPE